MTELVERYVHRVGAYLPKKERADIEAELRSQILDQLDDRYAGSPSQTDVMDVLTEMGDPRRMAVSYGKQQYLVGPDLYPFMMTVLRYGWLIIPTIVVFVTIFGALISSEPYNIIGLVIEALFGALQAALIFSGVVVLIFAILQHSDEDFKLKDKAFDPLKLPKVDDPGVVDRYEAAFGSAFGIFMTIILVYWLRVGGLTLRFDLSDPGDVIPFPTEWMIVLILASIAMIVLQLVVLKINRWSAGTWTLETVLEVIGVFALYFAVFQPFFNSVYTANPALAEMPVIGNLAEIFAVSYAVIMLITRGVTLVRLWNYDSTATPSGAVTTGK
jgi:hypothetical protein